LHSLDDFRRLFRYDAWANREILGAWQSQAPPARSLLWLTHILWAERIWYERLNQLPAAYTVAPALSVADCAAEAESRAAEWDLYLSRANEGLLDQTSHYRNSKGEPWSSTVADILMHVLMHSTYHRGQIAADMRAAGQTPAYTDFIHGVRTRRFE
jgi:uncharacterized damage-inducible protein DinB